MCDYSLHNVKSRPAKVGDKLTTHNFFRCAGSCQHSSLCSSRNGARLCQEGKVWAERVFRLEDENSQSHNGHLPANQQGGAANAS
jgi:hypothetical protein